MKFLDMEESYLVRDYVEPSLLFFKNMEKEYSLTKEPT
jgi:hypothetical protein